MKYLSLIALLVVMGCGRDLPSCDDVPCSVKLYRGTLNSSTRRPYETTIVANRAAAQKLTDSVMFTPEGLPNFVVAEYGPIVECREPLTRLLN